MHAGIAGSSASGRLPRWAALIAAAVFSAAASEPAPLPPAIWFGAGFADERISISRAERDAQPQLLVREPPARRAAGVLQVTDLAYDPQGSRIYVGTCCEPGSGHLWRVDVQRPATGLQQDDQGYAVDVAGSPTLFARSDTWGTLLLRTAGSSTVREAAGIADVAVDGVARAILALIDSRRLRAVVPSAPAPEDAAHDPGLMVFEHQAGTWAQRVYALPRAARYCRIVPLQDGSIGLLVGGPDRRDPRQCNGDTLDVYDPVSRQRRTAVLKFPRRVRHLSADASSRFLLFTTVDGAVGWRTLERPGGFLAQRGFLAADW